MSSRILILSFWFSWVSASWAQEPHMPDPHVDILKYQFRIEISDTTNRIQAVARVHLVVDQEEVSPRLDLVNANRGSKQRGMKVLSVRGYVDTSMSQGVNRLAKLVKFTHRDDQLDLALPKSYQVGDTAVYEIEYEGIPADGLIISNSKFGKRTFFGDNWPDRAHHWLPVVDHPSDKAFVEFTIKAPFRYQVVANGLLIDRQVEEDKKVYRYASTVPLPTKVMVFGAAEFAVQAVDTVDGVVVSSWVYPENEAIGFYDYGVAPQVLRFFEEYIADYPYAKLANVQSKTRYGGMENAGCIFYSENSVTGRRLSEDLIAHEVAHQWFGNSASEASWYHIWLSEGFATYFNQLYREGMYGQAKFQAGMKTARQVVLDRGPQRAIVDTTVQDLNHLLNANSYQKGAWVLHMLRRKVGDEAFQQGIRLYYDRHKLGNALTENFQQAMEEASEQDLSPFFEQWIYTPGHPEIELNWSIQQGMVLVKVAQKQEKVFTFPLDLGIIFNDYEREIKQFEVSERTQQFFFPAPGEVRSIELDPEVNLLFTGTVSQ